ncbi:DUF397 domain-containing protein [Nocardia otitidiscaviarum]|nr:DUF397 domain-containing protein [Nocardia otitidiscaviarum]
MRRGGLAHGGGVGLRDSKNPSGPALVFSSTEWDAFAAGLSSGEFDHFV